MMERLTERIPVPKEEREVVVFTQGIYSDTIPAEMTHEDTRKVLRKLAEYEDLEDALNGISISQVVDGFIKTVESQTHEGYENGRILTNAEADKWKEYKQLEEQGLLLRLPCKVGDSIYSVVEDGFTIVELKFSLDFYARRKNDFGRIVFLTKEEAEQKLKEMEQTYE